MRAPGDTLRLYEGHEQAVAVSVELARECRFSLDELRYEYPDEQAPEGYTRQQWLERLTWKSAEKRYPGGVPQRVRTMVEHELELIRELDYAPYFLTIYDITPARQYF